MLPFSLLTYDGSTDRAYNISANGSAYPGSTASDMAYMYYSELGNLGSYDISGNPTSGWGLNNTGPFINLKPEYYWSGTENSLDVNSVYYFNFKNGLQHNLNMTGSSYAWAVRTVVPEPISSALFIVGAGAFGVRSFLRKKSGHNH